MTDLSISRTGPLLLIGIVVAAVLLGGPAANAVKEGEAAPDFTAASLTGGQNVSLSEHRGKLVFLDFWASWCPPCLTALPQLNELNKTFAASDLQMLAVNVDENPDKARRFLAKHPVDYPNATDPGGVVSERFGLETMPTSYLINREGVVVYVHEGFGRGDIERIRSEIEKALKAAAR
jgi:peroxiredoxin